MIMTGRTVLTLLFMYFSTQNSHGQVNLVPNPSFEEYSLCPDKESQIERVDGWFSPSNGTPDYYNYCSTSTTVSLPTHKNVYTKIPKTGFGIVGIFPYFYPKNIFYKEYVSTKLNKNLKKDISYYVEYYISPQNGIKDISIPCFIDKIGISFEREYNFISIIEGQPLAKSKYIGNENKIIDNIDEWTRISGCIFGDGEEYITIGSFNTNEQTITNKECFDYFPNNAYYYIDDVGVYEFDPMPDTILLCGGESKTIGHKFLDGTYQWNTGSQDSTIVVGNSGIYFVNVDMGSCILSDTVVVINMSDLYSYLPIDTTLCDGTKFTTVIPIPGKYLWNNGSRNNTIEISKEGIYSVQIENQCGTFTHSINVMTQECNCLVHTPNIFSPNDDAVNDEMIFYMDCQFQYEIQSLRIYDRWGSLVYDQKKGMNNQISWSGKFNGKALSSGLYCWVINYSYLDASQKISKVKSGNVTIIH